MTITKEQIKDIGWALSIARGFQPGSERLASAEAGFKALVMGEAERAAPKAYADACSARGQQTARNEQGIGERGRHEPVQPLSFEDDIKSKDW